MRQGIVGRLDDIDAQQEAIVDVARELVGACSGCLKMRARTKSGRQVLTTVCGSDALGSGEDGHEFAHVTREP